MEGFYLSPEFNDQVTRTVRQVLRQLRGTIPQTRYQRVPRLRQGKLQSELGAASDTDSSPSTATIEFWAKNQSTGNLEATGETDTCVNRWESHSFAASQLLFVIMLDGEWQPFAGEC